MECDNQTADHPLLPCQVCGAMADRSTPRREYVAHLELVIREAFASLPDDPDDAWRVLKHSGVTFNAE